MLFAPHAALSIANILVPVKLPLNFDPLSVLISSRLAYRESHPSQNRGLANSWVRINGILNPDTPTQTTSTIDKYSELKDKNAYKTTLERQIDQLEDDTSHARRDLAQIMNGLEFIRSLWGSYASQLVELRQWVESAKLTSVCDCIYHPRIEKETHMMYSFRSLHIRSR